MLILSVTLTISPVWANMQAVIERHCTPLGLLPEVVQGVIETESSGQALALGVQVRGVHRSYFPRDLVYAQALLDRLLAVTDNVGIGLMQVNWRAWKDRLDLLPHDLLDVDVNLRVGCHILQQALLRHGVKTGIGAYHSPTPWRQRAYSRRVQGAIGHRKGR
jgi:hypothetical protein